MPSATNERSGCLAALFRFLGSGLSQKAFADVSSSPSSAMLDLPDSHIRVFPYGVREQFLSTTELSFYKVISDVVRSHAVICVKVRLADIFFVQRPHENRTALNRIAQKHIDFLLCDPRSLRPIVGIELDDATHARPDRQERDTFVNQVFEAAELPLLHICAKGGYAYAEVEAQIAPFLTSFVATPLYPQTDETNGGQFAEHKHPMMKLSVPFCTNCGISMVVRTVAQGTNRGKQFYGCANFPRCRIMLPLT